MRRQAMAWSIQLALMGVAATAGAQQATPSVQQLDTVQVTGSRVRGRTAEDTAAPVDVIGREELNATGALETLLAMQERARAIGAELRLLSQPGQTVVEIVVK